MATSDLTLEQILDYFRENGGTLRNRDVVTKFRKYLTDPSSRDDARRKFKEYVNTLAQSKLHGGEKFLYLRHKYTSGNIPSPHSSEVRPVFIDPKNEVRISLSPTKSVGELSSTLSPRPPPPYRPPPPVASPTASLDNISLNSYTMSLSDPITPQPPPRRKSTDRIISTDEDTTPKKIQLSREESDPTTEKQKISVKERTQKFNRMASTEDELSPRQHKTPDKLKSQGADEDDGASVTSIEPKKCVEWYVTASKGDCQELLKLAKDEPRLVNRKDPFTYNVLHWGAKHGNAEIIKIFAGTYKVDVNAKTNGGYTPLHIAAQFGHKTVFKLLIEVYKANSNLRDYSGRTPEYYLLAKEQTGPKNNLRKIKGRKKQSEKDLGFLRIGSLNVRVKKTTEAFSNFLGVGTSSVNPLEAEDKVHKGWGSADNVSQTTGMAAPKGYAVRKKSKRMTIDSYTPVSTPTTPIETTRNMMQKQGINDSDSDTAAGFDSQWKN